MKTKIFVALLLLTNYVLPQIGGISGSKLCVPSYDLVPKGTIEFEPALSIFRADHKFGDSGSLENLSGEDISSDLAFRITTGITDNLELGASFTTTMDQVFVGGKYAFPFGSNEGFAIATGFSIPAGNRFIPDSLNTRDDYYTASMGGILSVVPMNNFYVDGSVAFTRILGKSSINSILDYGVSVGYYLTEDLQPIVELSGCSAFNGKYDSGKISFNYGATMTISEKFLIVLGSQIDLTGKNEEKGINYFSAFCITIN